MASQAVDYMAQSNATSPVQHFWTLGVEEQFYIVWPIALIVAVGVAARIGQRASSWFAGTIGALTLASFVYSVVFTQTAPDIAYYSTFTRAWEFGAGALLALLLRRRPRPFGDAIATVASWAGFAAIAAAMFFFTAATPFPSYTAALPVLGTVMVIAAGAPRGRLAPTKIISLRPVQFVGDVSYGVYLWHWPIIVLLPFITGHPLSTAECLAVAAASIALGWLSKRLVEDPWRRNPWLGGGRPRRALWSALTGMAVVTLTAVPLAIATVPPAPRTPTAPEACWGAMAMTDPADCGPADEVPLVSNVHSFSGDLPSDDVKACEITVELATYRRCEVVEAPATGTTVALVGDSHATRWVESFSRAASQEGWGLSTFLVSGCPLVSTDPIGGVWGYDPVGAQLCPVPTAAVIDEITADPSITDVVLTNRTRLYITDDTADHPLAATSVATTIRALQAAGKNVIVLPDHPEVRGIPILGGSGAIDCLSTKSAAECWMPRSEADFKDPMRMAASETSAPVVDMTDLFCDAERCLWQIGGLAVYTDDNHLTRSFAASLAPPLAERLVTAGVGTR
jgi:peptidoglycan/LPS O-acetylase OafA/YrhL